MANSADGPKAEELSNEDYILDVKGLGRPRKNFSIKELLKNYKADIV